jgi:site-specific DNA recombinase
MIEGDCVALYARVSSDGQARDNTIASQIAALQERVAVDGFRVLPDHAYVDEGYSGTILLRPALEKLRYAVAAGIVTRIYIHAPDRLVRRYAHQILLIEEFHRVGAEVIFLNHSIGGTAEDDLLLQVQGVIAEYERAKILERGRRGRRHAARSGSVSALTGAPFGYRYVRRDLGGGVARFEVVEEEAHIVRLIFAWIGLERASMRDVCRRLERMGCQTRQGAARWYASTIHGMLDNPAYIGRAVFGRVHYGPARPRPRPIRGHPLSSPRPTQRILAPREEWIEIPVPALVDPAMFAAVRAQLDENRKRKRDRKTRSGWLLQGLAVCCGCGYAYCGKAVPRSRKEPSRKLRYYLCSGSEGYRFGGSPPCANRSVRADQLEEIVWGEVRTLLEDPSRVEGEYRRRLAATRDGIAMPEEIARLDRQSATLRRGIERLIDSYAEGVIEKSEFTPRIAGLKQRLSQLEERRQAAEDAAGLERDLSLIISRMEDFAEKVVKGLDNLDCDGKREIVRTVVRRIEIDQNNVEVIFRVPPNGGSPEPDALNMSRALQHCTDVRHPDVRLERGKNAVVAFLQQRPVLGGRAENGHSRYLPAAKLFDFFGASGLGIRYRPFLTRPSRHIGLVFRIPPPIEKERFHGPFVGEVFQQITDECDRLIFGNDRAIRMPAFQIVRQCRGFAAKTSIGVLKNRNQIWPQVLGLFPQRLGHDDPIERNPPVTQERPQLDRVRRCRGSDQPIASFIHARCP